MMKTTVVTTSRRVVFSGALLLTSVYAVMSAASLGTFSSLADSRTRTSDIKGNVEHGRYLVEQVAMCPECHSSRDEKGDIIPNTRFMGGPIPFRPPWPNDWATLAPRNGGLPGYTDELAIRLLTQGAINREGRQLRPPMPRFRMTPQDAADVVAYLRTIK
jgi:mono/diheme cytochrome c family protein